MRPAFASVDARNFFYWQAGGRRSSIRLYDLQSYTVANSYGQSVNTSSDAPNALRIEMHQQSATNGSACTHDTCSLHSIHIRTMLRLWQMVNENSKSQPVTFFAIRATNSAARTALYRMGKKKAFCTCGASSLASPDFCPSVRC